MKLRYSGVLFRTDFAAGIKLPPNVAVQHSRLQSSKSWPDLQIVEPSHVLYGDYKGLFIELKAPDVVLYKQDGTGRTNTSSLRLRCFRSYETEATRLSLPSALMLPASS